VQDAYKLFVDKAQAFSKALGKTVMNWNEVYNNFKDTLDKDTVVHVWLDKTVLQDCTKNQFRGVLSNNAEWYLDGLDRTWDLM